MRANVKVDSFWSQMAFVPNAVALWQRQGAGRRRAPFDVGWQGSSRREFVVQQCPEFFLVQYCRFYILRLHSPDTTWNKCVTDLSISWRVRKRAAGEIRKVILGKNMKEDEIQDALSQEKLDLRMDVDPQNPEHKWFQVALEDGRQLCAGSGRPLSFTFNCSHQIQAYALYKHKLVVVSAGCFDFICRLADRIVEKGIYQGVGVPKNPDWTPSPENSAETIRNLIAQRPFFPSKATWRDDTERRELFRYLMLMLFRLVVLHEIGHFYHRHGKRFDGEIGNLDIDSAQPKLLPEDDALDSQARELVADKFACENLTRMVEEEANWLYYSTEGHEFASRFLDTRLKRISFVLQIAYIYFVATDRLSNADPIVSVRMSHPPASFRLVTIVATAGTGFDSQEGATQLNNFIRVADAIMAVTLDRIPDLKWLAQLDHPGFSRHYAALYNKFDDWAVTSQKAPEKIAENG
jgi:hypothetical protein